MLTGEKEKPQNVISSQNLPVWMSDWIVRVVIVCALLELPPD